MVRVLVGIALGVLLTAVALGMLVHARARGRLDASVVRLTTVMVVLAWVFAVVGMLPRGTSYAVWLWVARWVALTGLLVVSTLLRRRVWPIPPRQGTDP